VCHRIDVYEQLRCGVRCLDFRYSTCDQQPCNIVIRHGPHVGGRYFDELDKVVAFLKENPNEFIIIDMDREYQTKTTGEQLDFMLDHIDARLKSLMISQADMDLWFNPCSLRLSELLARKNKRLLLLVDHHLYNRNISHHSSKGIGLFFRSAFIESKWNNTSSPVELMKRVEAFHRGRTNDPSKIRITSYTLTPQTDCRSICKLLCCIDSLRVDNNMHRLFKNRFLQKLVRRHLDEFNTIQFVMTDMISSDLHLLTYVVGVNGPAHLQIHHSIAVVDGKPLDLTQRLHSLVNRKLNSLWIIDAKQDLDLRRSASLFIYYSFGDEQYLEAVEFDSSSQLIINCFTTKPSKQLSNVWTNHYINEVRNALVDAFLKKCIDHQQDMQRNHHHNHSEI